MNTKKILALLAALLMIVTLFSACGEKDANKAADNKADTAGDKATDKTDTADDDKTDAPDEAGELATITWLGRENTPENVAFVRDNGYENFKKLTEIFAQYGFKIEEELVSFEVYPSTVQSLAAANSLPDAYLCYGAVDNNTIVNWIENDQLLSCTEIMNLSSGNMANFFGEDGALSWGRAAATYTDGDWYYVFVTNNPSRSIQVQESDGPLRVVTQIHGAYAVMTRQDWLDMLGLEMPQTAEEYYEACLAMNQNDVNGNGNNDERIKIGLGTEYQYQGIGQWFGLPYIDFIDDPSTGEIEVGILCEGFDEWAAYLRNFHANGLVYNNEGGHPWISTGNFLAENDCISWTLMQDNLWSSGKTNTGLDTCNYQPMPIISAVEGIKPRLILQEATAGEWGVGFNANSCDYQKAANMVDCMYSYELYLLCQHGIEGKAWEYEEDGVHIDDYFKHEGYVKGDIEDQYMRPGGMQEHRYMGMHNYFPTPSDSNLWDPTAMIYSSYQEAIDAGEPYAQNGYDEARWDDLNDTTGPSPCFKFISQIAEIGEENINWTAYYNFITLPTLEESAIQTQYATDLKTFLLEVGTKLITGEYEFDQLQSYIDYANESLGLQEYLAVMQARMDRFTAAMGL